MGSKKSSVECMVEGIKGIRQAINSLPPNYIALFVTRKKTYAKTNMDILKILVDEKKLAGIYVTINRPYKNLVGVLKKNGIRTDNLFFIDCITKTGGGRPEMTENCLYIASPQSLTELGVALTQATEAMGRKENKFLFLDSLSVMSIYNELATVAQFSHFLTAWLRLQQLKGGILISMEKEIDEKLLLILTELCDRVIEVR